MKKLVNGCEGCPEYQRLAGNRCGLSGQLLIGEDDKAAQAGLSDQAISDRVRYRAAIPASCPHLSDKKDIYILEAANPVDVFEELDTTDPKHLVWRVANKKTGLHCDIHLFPKAQDIPIYAFVNVDTLHKLRTEIGITNG